MPGPVVTMSSTVTCSHAGQATPTTPSRVTVMGAPAVTMATPYVVAGCALTGTPTPPCVTGQWVVGAVRVTSMGVPLAVQSGTSITTPTGSPMLPLVVQPRVVAT